MMASKSDRPVSASTISTVTAFTSISVTTSNDASLVQQPAAGFHNHYVTAQALKPPPPPVQKSTTSTAPGFIGPSSSKPARIMSGFTLPKPRQLPMSDSLGKATVPKQNVISPPKSTTNQESGSVIPVQDQTAITTQSISTHNSGTATLLSSSEVAEPNCATECNIEAHREIWEEARLELCVTETKLRQAKAAYDAADCDEMIMFKAYSEARLKPLSHPSPLPLDATTAKSTNKKQQRQDRTSVDSQPPTMWTFPASTGPSDYFPSFVEVLPFSPPNEYFYRPLDIMQHIVCMSAYAMWSPQELRLIYYQQIEQCKERTDAWSTAMAQSRTVTTRPRLAWEKPSKLTTPPTAIITTEENLQPKGKAIWEEAAWESARRVARLRRSAQLQAEVTYQAAFLDEQIKFQTYSDMRRKVNMCSTMGFGY